MSCKKCDEIQDKGNAAYYRVKAKSGFANVGILGCDEHVAEVFLALMEAQRNPRSKYVKYSRPIVRLKKRPDIRPEPKMQFNVKIGDKQEYED